MNNLLINLLKNPCLIGWVEMLSKKKWVFISLASISIFILLMNLRPYFFGMDEVDNKVRNFLVQVFRENNEPYFIEHLFIKYRENKDVEEDQIEALRSFLEKHGKLEKILFLKGELVLFTLEEGEFWVAKYLVVADYEKQKKLKYEISFVKVESDFQYYGFSFF
jgi:hypothetical protein